MREIANDDALHSGITIIVWNRKDWRVAPIGLEENHNKTDPNSKDHDHPRTQPAARDGYRAALKNRQIGPGKLVIARVRSSNLDPHTDTILSIDQNLELLC